MSPSSIISERTGVTLGFLVSAVGTAAFIAALAGSAHYRVGANEESTKELRAEVKQATTDQQQAAQLAATLLERMANLQKSMDRLEERLEERLGARLVRGAR